MKKESDGILLRIFISESEKYEGKPLLKYLIEFFKTESAFTPTKTRSSMEE
jgi:PII-like signaling protein